LYRLWLRTAAIIELGGVIVIVPTELADYTGNFIRMYVLTQFPAWRPFAFRYAQKANVLSADFFVDKPLSIHSNFSSLTFEGKSGSLGEVYEETYTIDSQLSVDSLNTQSAFDITGGPMILARTLQPTKLTVFYLYHKGFRKSDDNRVLFNADVNTVIFASRHRLVEDIGFTTKDIDERNVQLEFSRCDPRLISQAVNEITGIFSGYMGKVG